MQTQEVVFTVTKRDYRAAYYYITYTNRKPLYVVNFGMIAAFTIYFILAEIGLLKFWSPSVYITSVAVFWLLWQITRIERSIRQYARSKESILDKKSILRFTDARMTVKIPEKAFSSSGLISDYPCAFENRLAFLVYTSGADLFLIPTRAFKKTQMELFRSILASIMGDRFVSRFNKHAPHIPTAAEIEAGKIKQAQAEEEAAAKEAEKAHSIFVNVSNFLKKTGFIYPGMI